MHIAARIKGIRYTPFLCRRLKIFNINSLKEALSKDATFILDFESKKQIAISWWVSAKRTRSYPYARVYDSLSFPGKKATIIPILKDEGLEGDRDFLQWDTISLMSLLGVYTIIAFYSDAEKSPKYKHKITRQRYNITHLKREFCNLLSYQSDALHWNLTQIDKVGMIGQKALIAYENISKKLGVEMHSAGSAEKRIQELLRGKEKFMSLSRELAEKAQKRESLTIQPKENLSGEKATLTIKNYLGGYYYFTCDEVAIDRSHIYLIEGKHTKISSLPSLGDIKDGLLKMILFTNLEDVKVNNENYQPVSVLKLTTGKIFDENLLNKGYQKIISRLKKEATINNFKVMINQSFL